MEMAQAKLRKKKWGDKYCEPTVPDKVTEQDKDIGNYGCVNCGLAMSLQDRIIYIMKIQNRTASAGKLTHYLSGGG